MTRKPGSLNERDRAMLRATLAFPGTAPAVFTNENVRGLLGADKTCMTCPRCGNALPGETLPRIPMRRMLLRLCEEYVTDGSIWAEVRARADRGHCPEPQPTKAGIASIIGRDVQAIF